MELHEALKKAMYDTRLMEWHLKQGTITQADIDKHMKSLPDLADQAEPLSLENEHGNGSISEQ